MRHELLALPMEVQVGSVLERWEQAGNGLVVVRQRSAGKKEIQQGIKRPAGTSNSRAMVLPGIASAHLRFAAELGWRSRNAKF